MNIVIQGLGEMGASLALILNQQPENHVVGVDVIESTRVYALKHHIVSQVSTTLANVAVNADVIILATPVSLIKQAMVELSKMSLKKDVIITDTGSTKSDIMAIANSELRHQIFIGGHAMAGTHQSGIDYANSNLYDGAPYFLTANKLGMNHINRLKTILTPIQAKFKEIDVAAHDNLMAVISDVPHIAAFALMNTAVKQLGPSEKFGNYVAGGFKDTTRIAASDPKLWADILLSNKDSVVANNQALITELQAFNTTLLENDLTNLIALIQSAQISRQNLLSEEHND